MKSYLEMIKLLSFEERFEYLKLNGVVSEETFGSFRWLNQSLYRSKEWKSIRDQVIVRDLGCDLAIQDRPLRKAYIHHINPISICDIQNRAPSVFDLNNLVCVSFETHQAIHYGDISLLLPTTLVSRERNDTIPWR